MYTSYRLGLALLFAGASVASLAANGSAEIPAAQPAPACSETGRWLSFADERLQAVAPAAIIDAAAGNEVVLLGEQHDVEDHHRWQLQVLAALHAQRPEMVIGFEMFPRRVQAALDLWVAGKLSTQEFLARSEWEKVWNFPPQYYLPLFEFARINRIPMLALNVDRKLTRSIAAKGWDGVALADREGVGRPAVPPPAYRAALREIYSSHLSPASARDGGPQADEAFENFLASQLTWDRAMAEALARRAAPVGKGSTLHPPLLVGIIGSGHLRFGHGVAHQLRALGIERVATLLPVSSRDECRDLQSGEANAVFLLPDKPQLAEQPPRLGVTLENASDGVRITGVSSGSLAESSGLRTGDRIVKMAGTPVKGPSEVSTQIRRQLPGTWLPLTIARQDSRLEIVVRFPVATERQ